MDYCVTSVAELIKAHMVQLNFLRAPLYILPSLLHLGIACTVSQGLNLRKHALGDLQEVGEPHHLHWHNLVVSFLCYSVGNLIAKYTGVMN